MFRPKKNATDESRFRLATESCMRDLAGLKELLGEATEKRGCVFELPWTTNKPSQVFILTVRWDKSKDDPVWTLYDEIDGKSTPVWSEPFPPQNVELVYDILVMSTGAPTTKVSLPENLKSQGASGSNVGGLASKFPPKSQQASASHTDLPAAEIDAANTNPGVQPEEVHSEAAPTTPSAQPIPSTQPTSPPQPTADKPAQPAPPSMAPPAFPTAMPQPQSYPYQPAPAMAYPGQPAYPPPYPVAQGYPAMQPSPYIFPQQPPQPPNMPGFLFQPAQIAPNYPTSQPTPNWTDSNEPAKPFDARLFDKSCNILLGELLTRAEIITEPTLEAALKIQDLVQEGKLTADRAPEILKKFFSNGGSIENYLDQSSSIKEESGKAIPKTKQSSNSETKSSQDALALLIKSGVLLEADLKLAEQVHKDHGGLLSDILQAAGKLDDNTFEAAVSCTNLEKEGLLKLEQCIIALNYCSRSRVSLDEALDELNWENPLKKKKEA